MSTEVKHCKLCNTVAPLCRSHIVPEFAYNPIKNENDQIMSVGKRVKKVQTGYYERMLCRNCEALLSEYERVFKQDWMDTVPPDFSYIRSNPLRDSISVSIPNYDKFKLFHLSVLWRAAVSDGFKAGAMTLGPHADKLRVLVKDANPGNSGDYPFIAALNLDEHYQPVATVTQLAKGDGRFEGHHYYMMSYCYCDWIFVIARPGPDWMADLETKNRENNEFTLLTSSYKNSKSFNLWKQIIKDLRT